jgi:photosystem II stability/assembly factor-like uncharacterized protein
MDRLEHELRDVLTDQRRALSAELVSLEAVHAGAARRRRRRTSVVAAVGAVVLVSIAVPVSQRLLDDGQSRRAVNSAKANSPTDTTVDTASGPPAPKTVVARPLGPAWNGARVTSVTATSSRTFIALGYERNCSTSTCLRLAQSNDSGHVFTALAVPKGVEPGGNDPTVSSVLDVRFGSASDGWLFGDALYSTHDGGASWGKQKLPGRVMRLEAAAGTAWALVTDGLKAPTVHLWRSPVASDDWTKVPDVTLSYAVDLTVQSQHVVAVGGEDSKAWVGDSGKFDAVDNPCPGGVGLSPRLSATGSIWASCVNGTSAQLLMSADGKAWKSVVPTFLKDALPNQVVAGARSESDAVLALGPNEPFYRVQADGSGSPVKQSPTTPGATSYIGFTTRSVGYSITGEQLWRTEDGGDTWTLMRIG